MTDPTALADGTLARHGFLSPDALDRAAEILARVKAAGIETVRVLFADAHGVLRGKTVVADMLPSVFRSGLRAPSTLLLKDTSGRTVFPVWSGEGGQGAGAGDMWLIPVPATFRELSWSPGSAWLFCDLARVDGTPISYAPRQVLKGALDRLAAHGWGLTVGLEVEFTLFEVTNPHLEHADSGLPGTPPDTRLLAPGYQFLADATYDRMEPVLDELRRAAQSLGMPLTSVEIEMGPGQVEFVFGPADAMTHADTMIMLRAMAKQVAARRGLHASFMCRPKIEGGASAGWHLHQSLTNLSDGRNLFMPADGHDITPEASGWIAGLLAHAEESCLLTTPTVNGYKRYQPFQMAPDRIQWGRDNRGAMVRALMVAGDRASRIENRVAEPGANPYYVFASQIISGLAGIAGNLTPPPPSDTPYAADVRALPRSMGAALSAFEASALYRDAIGPEFVTYLSTLKRAEWARYAATVSDWEQREYFGLL